MTTRSITPLRDMLTLRDAMDRLFDQSIIRPWAEMPGEGLMGLPVDIEAKDDEYILTTSVPGLKPEDLSVEVVGETVTIKGEIKQEHENGGENYLVRERSYGRFSRSLSLPAPLNAAKAEATVENGVLRLRLPKADEARPKAIAVKVKK